MVGVEKAGGERPSHWVRPDEQKTLVGKKRDPTSREDQKESWTIATISCGLILFLKDRKLSSKTHQSLSLF